MTADRQQELPTFLLRSQLSLLFPVFPPLFNQMSSIRKWLLWLLKPRLTPSSAPLRWTMRWASFLLVELLAFTAPLSHQHNPLLSPYMYTIYVGRCVFVHVTRRKGRGGGEEVSMVCNWSWVGGASKHHMCWPLTSLWDQGGVTYPLSPSLFLSHTHTHTLGMLPYLLVRPQTGRWVPPWPSWGWACYQTCARERG